jgi:hypothetical protein
MKNTTLSIVALVLMSNVQGQNFNKIAGSSIRKAIGSDLKGYQTFSYPVDNFGLASCYQVKVSEGDFICDMWSCLGESTPPSSNGAWMDLKGFAAKGNGGAIAMSTKKKSKLAFKVVLPKFFDVADLGSNVTKDKVLSVDLTIGSAYMRKLRRQPFVDHINGLDHNSLIWKAYNTGQLVVIVSDCVIDKLSVTVTLDATTAATLDAKLGSGVSRVFSDASMNVGVTRVATGKYVFEVEHPVVFARYAKKQPAAGVLGADADFNDWIAVAIGTEPTTIRP